MGGQQAQGWSAESILTTQSIHPAAQLAICQRYKLYNVAIIKYPLIFLSACSIWYVVGVPELDQCGGHDLPPGMRYRLVINDSHKLALEA